MDERKLKKTKKICEWMLFGCCMYFLLFAGILTQMPKAGIVISVAGILFLVLLLLAVVTVIGTCVAQIVLNVKKDGWKNTLKDMLKQFLAGMVVAGIWFSIEAVRKKTGFHVEMVWQMIRTGFMLCICFCYAKR